MAPQRLAPSRRPARLVPVVLPLLPGPPHAGRGSSADQALEGDPPSRAPGRAQLRAGRSPVPQAPAAGAAALGVRQPEDLTFCVMVRGPRVARASRTMVEDASGASAAALVLRDAHPRKREDEPSG